MTICFLCGKKLGILNEEYSIKDFQNDRLPPPSDMKEDDRTCASCFNHRKDVERANPNSDYDSRPTSLLYLVPIFMGLLGGVLMYIAVKDQDQGMANAGMWVGAIMGLIEVVILFIFWGSVMSTLGNIGNY